MSTPHKHVGRPAGSGAQLPAAERSKVSRAKRAAAGAVRLDFTLEAHEVDALTALIEHWGSRSRKEAIARAIREVAVTIRRQTNSLSIKNFPE